MSRNELRWAIRPSEISSTWSAHGSQPPLGARPVLREAGGAVGLDREQARALAADAVALEPLPDLTGALEPQLEGRHRERRVLLQQPGQRVHVVLLEGGDVAVEQLALLVVERLDGRVGGDVVVGDLGAGALQRGVDRGDAGVEQLGDLGRLPAQHLAQDQHRALARRQVLERVDEGEPQRLARGGELGGVGLGPRSCASPGSARARRPRAARRRGTPRRPSRPGRGPSAGRGAGGR